jgi:hypothetical protein
MIVSRHLATESTTSLTSSLLKPAVVAVIFTALTSCSQLDQAPSDLPGPPQDSSHENQNTLPPVMPDHGTSQAEEALPEPSLSEDVPVTATPDCTYEWVTGIAEVETWENDRAILIFYPGEIRLSVERDSISPFLTEQQREIKSRLQKPLNNYCGKPAISFSPDLTP